MKKDYETLMTIGLGITVNLTNHPTTDEMTSELPKPEGRGWRLLQVIPVHNNNRYLQFFWERESLIGSDDDTLHDNGAYIKQNKIKLKVQR
jgi:hypothetical protein